MSLSQRVIRIQGSFAYDAYSMIRSKSLNIYDFVELVHEPNNKYDPLALKIFHKATGAKLGYVPKEITREVAEIMRGNYTAHICSVKQFKSKKHGQSFAIDISIETEQKGIQPLPSRGGVYLIENIKDNLKYFGQSEDINQRVKTHIQRLRKGTHENFYLQQDWVRLGESAFKFSVIELIDDPDRRQSAELALIRQEKTTIFGYNRTDRSDAENRTRILNALEQGESLTFSTQRSRPIRPRPTKKTNGDGVSANYIYKQTTTAVGDTEITDRASQNNRTLSRPYLIGIIILLLIVFKCAGN